MRLPLPWLLLALVCAAAARAQAPNLLPNGSFDVEGEPLKHWKLKYALEGESEYFDNHEFVSTVNEGGARKNVLKLHVPAKQAGWEGVKVDSDPVPLQKGKKYTFSCTAKSSGPDCRILLEGYRWRPGIKPHPNPELHELRKCFKFEQIYFNDPPGGSFGGVGKAWKTASTTFPKPDMKPLQKEMYEKVEFVVVHAIGIGGGEGDLWIDDVRIEETK